MQMKTVLCPADFSSLTQCELQVAVEVCRVFEAQLVIEHNRRLAVTALAQSWNSEMENSDADHGDDSAEICFAQLLTNLPRDVEAQAIFSHGTVVPTLVHLADTLPADLIILGTQGWSNETHVALAERLIDCCPCPVLIINGGSSDQGLHLERELEGTESLPDILVPTDFSEAGNAAMQSAFELARKLSVRLHVVHAIVPPHWSSSINPNPDRKPIVDQVRLARERLIAEVPGDLADRVHIVAEVGTVAEVTHEVSELVSPQLLMTGRHGHGALRELVTHEHARLHHAHAPIEAAGASV